MEIKRMSPYVNAIWGRVTGLSLVKSLSSWEYNFPISTGLKDKFAKERVSSWKILTSYNLAKEVRLEEQLVFMFVVRCFFERGQSMHLN